jgi:hypothetical protein
VLDLDRVLQGVDLLQVLRIVRVDERADGGRDVTCADLLFVDGVWPGAIVHGGHVLILVDQLQ